MINAGSRCWPRRFCAKRHLTPRRKKLIILRADCVSSRVQVAYQRHEASETPSGRLSELQLGHRPTAASAGGTSAATDGHHVNRSPWHCSMRSIGAPSIGLPWSGSPSPRSQFRRNVDASSTPRAQWQPCFKVRDRSPSSSMREASGWVSIVPSRSA